MCFQSSSGFIEQADKLSQTMRVFESLIHRIHVQGSVKMLAEQGWDGVKFDSCSMFHNLTRWVRFAAHF